MKIFRNIISITLFIFFLTPSPAFLNTSSTADFKICYQDIEYRSSCVSAREFVRTVRATKDVSKYFSAIDFDEIALASLRTGIDPFLITAMAYRESHFKHSAESHAGAFGVMQIIPGTRAEMQEKFGPIENDYTMGAIYLKHIKTVNDFDWVEAIVAYNEGPTRVSKRRHSPLFATNHQYLNRVVGTYLDFQKVKQKLGISSVDRSLASAPSGQFQ